MTCVGRSDAEAAQVYDATAAQLVSQAQALKA